MISHLATRLMGIEPDAPRRAITTLGRLPAEVAWAQLDHVSLGANDILVRHEDGNRTTTLRNHAGPDLTWEAEFAGEHPVILVDDAPQTPTARTLNGTRVSVVTVEVKAGQRRVVKAPAATTASRAHTDGSKFGTSPCPLGQARWPGTWWGNT